MMLISWGFFGGAGSLEQAALRLEFPANREFNRDILKFWLLFKHGAARHVTQFTALSSLWRPLGLKKNSELFSDIRES
jgi:hypothetical protein